MDAEGPRHAEVTTFDHGALIEIPAWFLMVVMISVTFLKLAIRFKATRNPGVDDALCFVGMVSSFKSAMACRSSANLSN
jgi:hypothetical protein